MSADPLEEMFVAAGLISPEIMANARKSRGAVGRVFDWNRAARRIKETGAKIAEAGLEGDWRWTGGIIYQKDAPDTVSYTYLASTWAIPTLILDGVEEPCFVRETPDENSEKWNEHTKWPASALAILKESK